MEIKKLIINDEDFNNLIRFNLDYYQFEKDNIEKFKNEKIIIKFNKKSYNIPNSPELEKYLWKSLNKFINKMKEDRC